jgi:hypothetical protein
MEEPKEVAPLDRPKKINLQVTPISLRSNLRRIITVIYLQIPNFEEQNKREDYKKKKIA